MRWLVGGPNGLLLIAHRRKIAGKEAAELKRVRLVRFWRDEAMLSFETTQWTLVVNAAGQGSADAREALGQLCDKYWQPLFEYARRRSRDEATANDSVQSFLARLIEKDTIAVANQERGKFRSFLIVSFKRFLNEKYVRANAQQRGGGQPVISLDQREDDDRKIEAADSLTAEQEFQRQWARTVLKLVMEQLEQDYKKQDRLAQFQQLKPFIAREDGQNYHEVAKQLQMTPSAARMASSRLRERFRFLLRQEIAQTVAGRQDVDEEIRDLFLAFQV